MNMNYSRVAMFLVAALVAAMNPFEGPRDEPKEPPVTFQVERHREFPQTAIEDFYHAPKLGADYEYKRFRFNFEHALEQTEGYRYRWDVRVRF